MAHVARTGSPQPCEMMVRASSRNRTISCHPRAADTSGVPMITSIGPCLNSHVPTGRTRRCRAAQWARSAACVDGRLERAQPERARR